MWYAVDKFELFLSIINAGDKFANELVPTKVHLELQRISPLSWIDVSLLFSRKTAYSSHFIYMYGIPATLFYSAGNAFSPAIFEYLMELNSAQRLASFLDFHIICTAHHYRRSPLLFYPGFQPNESLYPFHSHGSPTDLQFHSNTIFNGFSSSKLTILSQCSFFSSDGYQSVPTRLPRVFSVSWELSR